MRPKLVCTLDKSRLRQENISDWTPDVRTLTHTAIWTRVWSEHLPAFADGHRRPFRCHIAIPPGGLALIAVASASPPRSRRMGEALLFPVRTFFFCRLENGLWAGAAPRQARRPTLIVPSLLFFSCTPPPPPPPVLTAPLAVTSLPVRASRRDCVCVTPPDCLSRTFLCTMQAGRFSVRAIFSSCLEHWCKGLKDASDRMCMSLSACIRACSSKEVCGHRWKSRWAHSRPIHSQRN